MRWNADFSEAVLLADACAPNREKATDSAHRPKVFPSLCDWLDDEVPIKWLARFVCLIHDTPNLDWLLLTKRPELWNSRKWAVESAIVRSMKSECDLLIGKASYSSVRDKWSNRSRWFSDWIRDDPPRNVWIGASVEDQKRADERIPALLNIPAILRFLSVEPLLGPVEFTKQTIFGSACMLDQPIQFNVGRGKTGQIMKGIHWVIVGGESGPHSRPCNVESIRSIVKQCAIAGVPVFVKQLGANPFGFWTEGAPCQFPQNGWKLRIKDPKGGDPEEWPDDLRVRQFPEVKP